MDQSSEPAEERIIRSWHVNAQPWADAVRLQQIASRKLVTDRAIVEAVTNAAPRDVLDVGCGEGWLARALNQNGARVLGIDVVPALVEQARRLGGGEFRVHAYDDLAARRLDADPFDVVVCNFSLLGHQSVEMLIAAARGYLRPKGSLIIQTLHPVVACGNHAYDDGWREGSWNGFSAEFRDPPPWYFRTVQSWYAMLLRCGFHMAELREPTAARAASPASVIFICHQSNAVSV